MKSTIKNQETLHIENIKYRVLYKKKNIDAYFAEHKTFQKKILGVKFINPSDPNFSNTNTAFIRAAFMWRSEVNFHRFEIHTGLKIVCE